MKSPLVWWKTRTDSVWAQMEAGHVSLLAQYEIAEEARSAWEHLSLRTFEHTQHGAKLADESFYIAVDPQEKARYEGERRAFKRLAETMKITGRGLGIELRKSE